VIQREERVERKWNGFDARRRISPSSRRNGKDSTQQEGYPPSSRRNGKDSTRQGEDIPSCRVEIEWIRHERDIPPSSHRNRTF